MSFTVDQILNEVHIRYPYGSPTRVLADEVLRLRRQRDAVLERCEQRADRRDPVLSVAEILALLVPDGPS